MKARRPILPRPATSMSFVGSARCELRGRAKFTRGAIVSVRVIKSFFQYYLGTNLLLGDERVAPIFWRRALGESVRSWNHDACFLKVGAADDCDDRNSTFQTEYVGGGAVVGVVLKHSPTDRVGAIPNLPLSSRNFWRNPQCSEKASMDGM